MLRKGVRRSVEGVAAYVAGKTIDEVKEMYGLDEIIKLGSNENPYGPFDEARKAMMEEINHLHMYPDKSYEDLKEIIADKNQVKFHNIALSHGAGGMLESLSKIFIEDGDEVILPTQSYGLYREISKVMGGIIVESPLTKDYSIDIRDITEKINEKTKLVWICNPNNPTGTMITEDQLDSLIESATEKMWIIVDEAYIEFSDKAKRINTLKYIQAKKNVIIVRTMSKAYGLAGARIGYAIADRETINIIDTVAEPFNANRIGIAGAIATLTKDTKNYNVFMEKIVSERNKIEDELRKLGMKVIPTHTNFVFFETGLDASNFAQKLLEKGIIVRPCGGWQYPQAIRVTIGTIHENKRFIEEFKDVLRELKGE